MKPDPREMKLLLRKREIQLQNLMRQMKRDHLDTSPVYRNLEEELETLRNQRTHEPRR